MKKFLILVFFTFSLFAHDIPNGSYKYYGTFTKEQLKQLGENENGFKTYYIYLEIYDDRFGINLAPYDIMTKNDKKYFLDFYDLFEASGKIITKNNETFLKLRSKHTQCTLKPFLSFDKTYKIYLKEGIYIVLKGKTFRRM